MPDIVESDDFESPALFWLYREIASLDRALGRAGVADRDQRRRACEEYFFDLQDGLTQPVTASRGAYRPLLLMIDEGGAHLCASDAFDFHEYAGSIVDEYYESPHPA